MTNRSFLLDRNNPRHNEVRDRLIQYVMDLSTGQAHQVTVKAVTKKRSLAQNAGSHALYAEIAKQRGDVTPDEVKAECKLLYGIPLLCEDMEFAAMWERMETYLSYMQQIKMMDYFAVTSIMNVRQKKRYIDILERRYNVRLLSPLDGWDER